MLSVSHTFIESYVSRFLLTREAKGMVARDVMWLRFASEPDDFFLVLDKLWKLLMLHM